MNWHPLNGTIWHPNWKVQVDMGVSSNGGTPKWMVNIIIRRAKDRKDNANRAGFWNVMHRFKTENSYATIMTATGRNEDDIAEIDLMAVLHLPHLGRTHQRTTGSFGPFAGMSFKETPKSCPACILWSKADPPWSDFCWEDAVGGTYYHLI